MPEISAQQFKDDPHKWLNTPFVIRNYQDVTPLKSNVLNSKSTCEVWMRTVDGDKRRVILKQMIKRYLEDKGTSVLDNCFTDKYQIDVPQLLQQLGVQQFGEIVPAEVQKTLTSILMVVKQFTAMHVDLPHSSIQLVIDGSKEFVFINAAKLYYLLKTKDQFKVQNILENATYLKLSAGDMFNIAVAHHHAVYTPEKSLVITYEVMNFYNWPAARKAMDIAIQLRAPFSVPWFKDGVRMEYMVAMNLRKFVKAEHEVAVRLFVQHVYQKLKKFDVKAFGELMGEWITGNNLKEVVYQAFTAEVLQLAVGTDQIILLNGIQYAIDREKLSQLVIAYSANQYYCVITRDGQKSKFSKKYLAVDQLKQIRCL